MKITAIEIDGRRFVSAPSECATCGTCALLPLCHDNILFAHLCNETTDSNEIWKEAYGQHAKG